MRLGEVTGTHQQELECALEAEERAAVAVQWCALCDQISAAEEAEKARRKAAQGAIEELEVEAAELQAIVRSGKEKRQIQCETRVDYASNAVRIYRLDTGELVSERAMEAEERQRHFDWGSSISVTGGNAPAGYDREAEPPAGEGTRREALAAVLKPGEEPLPPEVDDDGWGALEPGPHLLTDDDAGLVIDAEPEKKAEPAPAERPRRKPRPDNDPVLQNRQSRQRSASDDPDFG
jgi:hypothetical protein